MTQDAQGLGALVPAPLAATIGYVPRKISHHALHGGYDVVFSRLGLREARSPRVAWLAARLPEALNWRLREMRPQNTGQDSLIAELSAAPWILSKKGRLCHFIYGEDTFFFTPLWRRKGCKLVASYHYPPDKLRGAVSPAALRSLDGVILVASNQRETVEQLATTDKIFVIPHHIDCSFFAPEAGPAPDRPSLVFAGAHLRDFDCLQAAWSEITAARKDVQLDLVAPPAFHARFADLPNVTCHSGIDDEALLGLYRKASLGLMPLLDCTAVNSVLEMMATGLPMVASDVGGVRDYLDEEGAALVPARDPNALAHAVLALLESPEALAAMAAHNRQAAIEKFSLPVIGKQLMSAYEEILGGP